jgi:3',5'-cyclic-AMP phosphodiesterase
MKRQINLDDGIDRRGFLDCMAWAGTALIWTFTGGVAAAEQLGKGSHAGSHSSAFNFVQISDSHIGFSKEANPDVTATLQEAVARINALPVRPSFILHTGDITHLSKPAEFDAAEQILNGVTTDGRFFVPGEHDVLTDNGKLYLERFGKRSRGSGWYSFESGGAHFIGLVNVLDLQPGGLGQLGTEQLEWLKNDLSSVTASTPLVVFAHVPLWTVYADWGWGTADALEAMALLRRFGSVTVLNGHIHQTMQKTEGNIMFHTAASTAFPQPKPGEAPSPGPLKVPNDQLRTRLGITKVQFVPGSGSLAIIDASLGAANTATSESGMEVSIDNFSFAPSFMSVPAGSAVTWVNHDDIPHNVISSDKHFASPVLDTGERFTHRFSERGSFPYYCSIHPRMTAKLVVV